MKSISYSYRHKILFSKEILFHYIVLSFFPAVDDHFAKALGDTWVKLQKEEYQKKRKETTDGGRQKVNVYAA